MQSHLIISRTNMCIVLIQTFKGVDTDNVTTAKRILRTEHIRKWRFFNAVRKWLLHLFLRYSHANYIATNV